MERPTERIVYFDGHCNVCNAFIDFLIRHDRSRSLKFAPLQGETAHRRLPPQLTTELNTMVLEDETGVTTESTAAIRTIAHLGGIYGSIKLLTVVPRFVRDWIYRWVANHRYLWWGKREACRVPTAEERALFLS